MEVNVVVADSLLHGSGGGQVGFSELEGQSAEVWRGEEFALEDEEAAKKVLGRRYAAVVGNPPYINVKDALLRKRYASLYSSCRMNYALTIPFMERFFQLAREGGRVGMITANSFMKREFGKAAIEEFLPTINLETIVNTSGAYIPGHGTPTVLLFGSNEKPRREDALTVLANRGEPATPEDPEHGLVWSSIAMHWDEVGFENDYISVIRTGKKQLEAHPWSLAGGGASELKSLIEARAEVRLLDVIADAGFSLIIGEDDVFIRPNRHPGSSGAPTIPLVIGENVRDWVLTTPELILRPFDAETLEVQPQDGLLKELWPWRCVLQNRVVSGSTTMTEAGRAWYDVRRLSREKHKTPLSIAFAFVATHNHFVLDRGGKVFNRSAPIIKLPETATEDDHLALLAYLNSSTACFWMKQVFFDKGASIDKNFEAAKTAYEFASTQLGELPLAALSDTQRAAMVTLARELGELASTRAQLLESCLPADAVDLDQEAWSDRAEKARSEDAAILERMIFLQEEVDWLTYEIWGLAPPTTKVDVTHPAREERLPLGARVSEVFAARRGEEVGIDGQRLLDKLPSRVPVRVQALVESRLRLVSTSAQLRLLETPMYKRRWLIPRVELGGGRVETFEDRLHSYCLAWLSDRVEQLVMGAHGAVCSHRDVLARARADTTLMVISESLQPGSGEAAVVSVLDENAVPYLAVQRHTEHGLTKHATWQETWQAQRREDLDEHGAEPTVPPKYTAPDFRSPRFYQLRGPLDVPKERFISYPHCESTESPSPLYGWAGWNHEQRARALATLYWSRKTGEGWLVPKPDDPPNTPDLTPMLAGLLELLPWLHQWHAAPSDDYGGDSPASYYSAFLEGQCQELGLTHDDLRAWRPPKTRGRSSAPKAPKPPKAKASKRTPKAKPAPAPDPTPPQPEPAFTLFPAPTADDSWKSTKKKSKKSPASATPATPTPASRRRKPSEPA